MPEKMRNNSIDIIIFPMNEADLDNVLAIETASFSYPWSRIHFLDDINSQYAYPLVAFCPEGIMAGYICHTFLIDEGHIMNVAIHHDYRGLGIGSMLVERVLGDCREKGAEFVYLEVRSSNYPAIALYRQFGFVGIGLRKRYYNDGEDAILMKYEFLL